MIKLNALKNKEYKLYLNLIENFSELESWYENNKSEFFAYTVTKDFYTSSKNFDKGMESTKEIYKENTLFETLKKYIVENATQNKNTKLYFIFDSENTKDYTSASDYNHEILIDLIKEYFLKHFDFDKDSYELKMNLNFYYDMDNIFKANMELEFVVNT